jgi:hypothetical protein
LRMLKNKMGITVKPGDRIKIREQRLLIPRSNEPSELERAVQAMTDDAWLPVIARDWTKDDKSVTSIHLTALACEELSADNHYKPSGPPYLAEVGATTYLQLVIMGANSGTMLVDHNTLRRIE